MFHWHDSVKWNIFLSASTSQSTIVRPAAIHKIALTLTNTHTAPFNEVKKVLSSPQILKLNNMRKPTTQRIDDRKLNGISVILYQQHQ